MIYEQKLLKLVGLKKEFSEMQPGDVSFLWQNFLPRLKKVQYLTGEYCYGVVLTNGSHTEYFCGVEVSSLMEIPQGLQSLEVPPSTYAKFKHTGPIATIGRTIHSIYSKWLPLCEWKHTQGPDLEIYDFDYNPASNHACMYYAIPIKT